MLRNLVIVMALLAALWAGLWFGIAAVARAGLDAWVELRRVEGWQVTIGPTRRSGFPLNVRMGIDGVTLDHPDAGISAQIPLVALDVAVWNPLSPTLHLPAQTVALAMPGTHVEAQMGGADVTVRLKPGLMLELGQAHLVLAPVQIVGPAGPVLSLEGASVEMTQDDEDESTYHVDLDADAVAAGSVLRDALALPQDWPDAFTAILARMTIDFDRPFDRTAQPGDRPQPRRIDLHRSSVEWGAMALAADATFDVDASGILDGTLSLTARNWAEMLDFAQAAGAFDPNARQQIENVLGMVARMSGRQDTIDIDITIADGLMSIGPVALGPAPRLYLQ